MDYLFTLTDAGCCWRITMRDAAPPPSLYTFRPAVDGSARDSAGFESAIPRILPVFFSMRLLFINWLRFWYQWCNLVENTIAFRVEIPGRDFFVVSIRPGSRKFPLANKVVHDLEIDHQIERRIWWNYFAQRLVPIDRFISRRDLVV